MSDEVELLKKELAEKDRTLQNLQEECYILQRMIQAMGLPDPFENHDKTDV